MKLIKLSYYDKHFFKYSTDSLTEKVLLNAFSVEMEDAARLKKINPWINTKIELIDKNLKLIPIGLVNDLQSYCKLNGIGLSLIDREKFGWVKSTLSPDNIREKISKFINKEFYEKINSNIYDHQFNSVLQGIKNKRGIFHLHPSTGKSLIIYLLIRYIQESIPSNKKICLIVPNISLVEQMFSDFKEFETDSISDKATRIYGSSKNKDLSKQIIITTYQSLKNKQEIYNDVVACFVDEAHMCSYKTQKIPSVVNIVRSLHNCEYLYGFTGSIESSYIAKQTIKSVFGEILLEKDMLESIEEGIVTDFELMNFYVDYLSPEENINAADSDFANLYSYLSSIKGRPDFLKYLHDNKIISPEENTFLIFFRKDSLKQFKDFIKEHLPMYKYGEMSGEVKGEAREKVRQEMNNSLGWITAGTYKVVKEGINIKNLTNIIYVDTFKTEVGIVQTIGRGIRLSPGKTKAKIINFIDHIKTGGTGRGKYGITVKHSFDRIEIYTSKNYKMSFYYIEYKGLTNDMVCNNDHPNFLKLNKKINSIRFKV